MKLIKTAVQFVQDNWDGKSPLLLGYSGGPDSKALLYALFEAGIQPLHLAHVDHGWREESSQEAEELQREAESLGLPFHLHLLTEKCQGNLEEVGRRARRKFFRSLFERIPFQALLLAHHADDLAETSLKRAFEGARLCSLGGMAKQSSLEGMTVWRPLLGIPKSDLLQFIQARNLTPLYDRTNDDPKFLRTRLRQEVIPLLEASFGKKISTNLVVLSERSQELKIYLDEQVQPLWNSRVEGPWGVRIDVEGAPRILQRHLLQGNEGLERFSREALEIALDALQKGARLQLTDQIMVERGSIFWVSLRVPKFEEPIELRAGTFHSGDWVIEIEPLKDQVVPPISWKQIWTGQFESAFPDGWLKLPETTASFREKRRVLGVPLLLRKEIPVIDQEGQIFDILTDSRVGLRWKARFTVIPKLAQESAFWQD